jgi:hypothetical protein
MRSINKLIHRSLGYETIFSFKCNIYHQEYVAFLGWINYILPFHGTTLRSINRINKSNI